MWVRYQSKFGAANFHNQVNHLSAKAMSMVYENLSLTLYTSAVTTTHISQFPDLMSPLGTQGSSMGGKLQAWPHGG